MAWWWCIDTVTCCHRQYKNLEIKVCWGWINFQLLKWSHKVFLWAGSAPWFQAIKHTLLGLLEWDNPNLWTTSSANQPKKQWAETCASASHRDCPIRQLVLYEKDFGWLSGIWTQKCCDHFGWWPLRVGRKSLWLKASMIGESGPCPFWIIPWDLPYNWGKARKTSVIFRVSLDWPAKHQSTCQVHWRTWNVPFFHSKNLVILIQTMRTEYESIIHVANPPRWFIHGHV
jgi:hypothetical protein